MKVHYKIYVRKSAGLKLSIRISFNNKRVEYNSGISISIRDDLDERNYPLDPYKKHELEKLITELKYHERRLNESDALFHPKDIIDSFKGIKRSFSLIKQLDAFIEYKRSEVKRGELATGTLKNYLTTQKWIKMFINDHYRKELYVEQFNLEFLEGFNNWLTQNTKCKNNGRAKHFDRLKVFYKYLCKHGLIEKNPFNHFSIKKTKYVREFLTLEEIAQLRHLIFKNKSLEKARDLYLFMCNTGLSYYDAQNLTSSQLEYKGDSVVIKGTRQKSNSQYTVPINEEAYAIMDKYASEDYLLPQISNQKFNMLLKQIARQAGINKRCTTHQARHNFASNALRMGIPIESIQKALGHKDLRMTLVYAKLMDDKLINDFENFNLKTDDRKKSPWAVNH